MNILKKMKIKYYNFLFRIIGVRTGPIMIRYRGDWLFIDDYGTVYLLRYTARPGMPLDITMVSRI